MIYRKSTCKDITKTAAGVFLAVFVIVACSLEGGNTAGNIPSVIDDPVALQPEAVWEELMQKESGKIQLELQFPASLRDGAGAADSSRFIHPSTHSVELYIPQWDKSLTAPVGMTETGQTLVEFQIPGGIYPAGTLTFYLLDDGGNRLCRGENLISVEVSETAAARVEIPCIPLIFEELVSDRTFTWNRDTYSGESIFKIPIMEDTVGTLCISANLFNGMISVYDSHGYYLGDFSDFSDPSKNVELALNPFASSPRYLYIQGNGELSILPCANGLIPVQDFRVSQSAFNNRIQMEWSVPSDKAEQFLVFRRLAPDGVWGQIDTCPYPQNNYVDVDVEAGIYYDYRIDWEKGGIQSLPGTVVTGSASVGNTWLTGSFIEEQHLYFQVHLISGEYSLAWDDSGDGSGLYTGNIRVSLYSDLADQPIMSRQDKGYTQPFTFSVQENGIFYIMVQGYSAYSDGTFALKVNNFLENISITRCTGQGELILR